MVCEHCLIFLFHFFQIHRCEVCAEEIEEMDGLGRHFRTSLVNIVKNDSCRKVS